MAKNPQADRNWREPIRKSEVATDFGISLARISGIFLQLRPSRAKSQEPKLRLVWRFAGCKIRPKSVGFPIIACSLHCAVKSAKKKGVSTSTVWWGELLRAIITRSPIGWNICGKFQPVVRGYKSGNMTAHWPERNTFANVWG